VFAALSPIALPGTPEYVSAALTLAFLSGVVMIGFGALRMGVQVNFVSDNVVVGFTAGVGVLIVISQLGNFFGVALHRGGSPLAMVVEFARHAGDARPWVIVVALVTLAAAVTARRWLPRIPYMVVSILLGSLAGYALNRWLDPAQTGIETIGALPRSLPPLSHPQFSAGTFGHLAGSAIALSVIALTQSISIARAIALKSGQRIVADQEFIGQGLANVAASFFSGFPTSASVNRSGPNFEAGARTPLAAVFAAGALAGIVFGFAPLAAYIPLATVAGSLVLVAWGLVDLGRIRTVIRAGRREAAVVAVTFLATIFLRIEFAVLAGVALSLIQYLARTSRPTMRSLVPDPRHTERRFAPVEGELRECPQLKIVAIEGSIYFGAVDHVATHFETLREVAPAQRHLLVVARNVNFIDLAGAELLVQEARRRRRIGGRLYLYGLRAPAEEVLERSGLMPEIGEENVFRSKPDAIGGIFARLDRDICARCTARIFRECQALPPPATDDSA
jgi:SulP family sulfate permease